MDACGGADMAGRAGPVPEHLENDCVIMSGASDQAAVSRASRRPHQVSLVRRCLSDNFGFTLRHFIVYPPDENDQEEFNPPLDTIFVNGLLPGGPAHRAGLRIGDRILQVNGAAVSELNYAEVVRQVQASGRSVHLVVVPGDDDELQQAFGDTAHHPVSNLNMKPSMAHLPRPQPYRPAGISSLGQLGQGAAHLSQLPSDDSSSLGGEVPAQRRPSTLSTLSLQMPPQPVSPAVDAELDPVYSRIRRAVDTKAEFLSRPAQPVWQAQPPVTPVVREYHVSPARFARPPWPPAAASPGSVPRLRQGSTPGGEPEPRRRRRYRGAATDSLTGGAPATAPAGGAPPSFPRLPELTASSHSLSSSADSVTSQTTGSGTVSNSTARPYGAGSVCCEQRGAGCDCGQSPEYVQYDAVTQVPRAKVPPPHHKTHIVSKRARQFETGLLDNDTSLELARGGSQTELQGGSGDARRASVRLRRGELERRGHTQTGSRLQAVMSDPELSAPCPEPGRLRYRRANSLSHSLYGGVADNGAHVSSLNVMLKCAPGDEKGPRRPPRSGNRVMIVGGPRLHAEPLRDRVYRDVSGRTLLRKPEPPQPQTPLGWPFAVSDSGRPLSKISEADMELPLDTGRGQQPGLQTGPAQPGEAVALRGRPSQRALRQPSYMAAVKTPTPEPQPGAPAEAHSDNKPLASAGDAEMQGADENRPRRPSFLPLTPVQDEAPEPNWPSSLDADWQPPLEALEAGQTSTPNAATADVSQRTKPYGEDDPDRTVRRISYLKATSGGDTGLLPSGAKEERTASIRAVKASSPSWPGSPPTSPPPTTEAPVTREGWLGVKLAQVDGKRALDRSWRKLWVVLRGDALTFYRDRKEVNLTPSSLEELPVNVALCTLDAADDYTRRKHVFRLQTHTGSEYLLQTEHLLERESWLEALRPVCGAVHNQDDSSRSGSDPSLLSPVSGGGRAIKKLTNLRQRSPTGLAPNAKTRKHSQTPEQGASPKSKTWKGRVARQLKKIHVGSPVTAAPQPVPDGSTLAVPLELCPPSASNPFVPAVVELCTSLVEQRGLDTEGLYRVPGNNAAIKSLSEAVNRGVHSVNLQADPRWTDVNVISSLLKSFFRKLPDSLVTSELYTQFIDVSKIEDPERRKLQLRKLVHELPDHNYETLKHLMRHLCKVTERSQYNKMDLKNLAIVFGPTLVRSSDDGTSAFVQDMSQQCGIVKTLISEHEWFFPPDEPEEVTSGEDVPPPLPSSSPPMTADLGSGPARSGPLFSSAQRVDGHQSPAMDPKSIVSSIIIAANRKAQQGRPAGEEGGDSDTGSVDGASVRAAPFSASECNNNQIKPPPSSSCAAAPPAEAASPAAARVHVIPIRLTGEAAQPAHTDYGGKEAAEAAAEEAGAGAAQDDTAIPSYAGLNQNTQERIRRFEEETRAMLQREKMRERELRDRDLRRAHIEREWARAKQDLEHPDFLDELADNPAEAARRLPDLSVRLGDASTSSPDQDRISVASDASVTSCSRRPAAVGHTWDTLSSGYSTMSSGGGNGRAGAPRARADSLPVRPAPLQLHKAQSLTREPRRSSEGGERARWLVPSSRLYRSPRPARRRGSAEDVATAQSRKVELKRSEVALKARAFDTQKVAGKGTLRRRGGGQAEGETAQRPAPSASPLLEVPPATQQPEQCDLVSSLVETLDRKLLELAGGGGGESTDRDWGGGDASSYRDPSLHRSQSASSQLQMMTSADGGASSGGSGQQDLPQPPAHHRYTSDVAKKGMKRSIRELCQRFERQSSDSAPAGQQRLLRAPLGSPRALKRRHTVGGSKDIDRFLRLFLSAGGRPSAPAAMRPASCLVELDLLPLKPTPLPLESRV